MEIVYHILRCIDVEKRYKRIAKKRMMATPQYRSQVAAVVMLAMRGIPLIFILFIGHIAMARRANC